MKGFGLAGRPRGFCRCQAPFLMLVTKLTSNSTLLLYAPEYNADDKTHFKLNPPAVHQNSMLVTKLFSNYTLLFMHQNSMLVTKLSTNYTLLFMHQNLMLVTKLTTNYTLLPYRNLRSRPAFGRLRIKKIKIIEIKHRIFNV